MQKQAARNCYLSVVQHKGNGNAVPFLSITGKIIVRLNQTNGPTARNIQQKGIREKVTSKKARKRATKGRA